MIPRLSLRYYESEPSKLWVSASDGVFAGSTEDYINKDSLEALAEELEQFPKTIQSESIFESSARDKRFGYIMLRFYCFDSIGHTAVQVTLDSNQSGSERTTVSLKMQFEANSLDSFLHQLRNSLCKGEGECHLEGISPYTQNIHN